MKINSKFKFGMFFVFAILFLVLALSFTSAYYRTQTNYAQYGNYGGGTFTGSENLQCNAGQDFILQVSPFGCEPSIVRSDLLEEQNVPVFCKISATQLNPLIDVQTINSISIVGDYTPEVATVGFHPAKAAVNPYQNELISPVVLDNIGYAVIELRQQPNESAIPEVIEGNLTARINYNIKNAFGVGRNTFYLPVLSDTEWEQRYLQYGFWDGRGYLRAEGVSPDEAVISIYSDQFRGGVLSGNSNSKSLYSTATIEVGESSNQISIPGFDMCLATMNLELKGVESPDTRARLRVNGELTEVVDGEKFLDNKCEVRSLDKKGFNEEVSIYCKETGRINLKIVPQVTLEIGGEEVSVGVGDYLYTSGDERVYLGYAGTEGNTGKKEDLYVYLVSIPGVSKSRLSDDEIESAKIYAEGLRSQSDGTLLEDFLGLTKFIEGVAVGSWDWVVEGQSKDGITYSDGPTVVFGKTIDVLGFSGAENKELSIEVQELFDKAIEDYNEIVSSYPDEKSPDEEISLGESSLYNLVNLANDLGQKLTTIDYCREFEEKYPNSQKSLEICKNELKLSNYETSSVEFFVGGESKRISFEGVYEPSKQEYGAKGTIKFPDGSIKQFNLGKGDIKYFDDDLYLVLKKVDDGVAVIETNTETSGFDSVGRAITNDLIFEEDVPKDLGSGYIVAVNEINLEKVARVSVVPNINYASTQATFKYKISVDKRDISLSPERAKEVVDSLEKKIETLDKVVDSLGSIVKVGKTSCLATGGFLTAKNYIQNAKGKGIARGEVMRGSGGWYERCIDAVSAGAYSSQDECLLDNSESIDKEVEIVQDVLAKQSRDIESLQSEHTTEGTFLSTKIIDEEGFVGEYSGNVKSLLDSSSIGNNLADPQGKNPGVVDVASLKEDVLNSGGWKENNFETDQLKDIELYTKILESPSSTNELKQTARTRLYDVLLDIQDKSEDYRQLQSASQEFGFSEVILGSTTQLQEHVLTNPNTFSQVQSKFSGGSEINPSSFVVEYVDRSDSKKYLVVLNDNFVVSQTYSISGNILAVSDEENINPLGLGFKKYDSTTYQNQYKNPEVTYYETEPYKGEPAVVPFDLANGWYSLVRQTLPVAGGIRGYDDSGVVKNYYICNVGQNGLEESYGGDDVCQQINKLSGQTYNQFTGLDSSESLDLINRAENAIFEAQRQYKNGVRNVKILGQTIPVGNPAVDLPEMQCQDFMSPKECNLLFNVCDPVICPSSRCDFGGKYPVKDVVQSGVIGSVALCLPNANEGIKVPVCLTGIHAGLDNFNQVQKSYRDCLQESLDTGKTVGICDEIQSVYMCEFFYRQGVPLAKVGVSKVTEGVLKATSGSSRAGGEYLAVQDAFQRAEQSVEYFTQYYAENSFNAFKARSVEDAGQELVCKQFLSANYPSGDFLDTLTDPDSPATYTGNFEEIPFTTKTNPPISQYKVFYHIYAGNDRGAYYSVYLKGDAGSSFFQDAGSRVNVATGYIAAGDYATDTPDFTATSGYKQLCVNVNGQEECGFKQVSTSFVTDYIRDSYVASQVSQTNIKTEAECNSGSASIYNSVNLNLQSAAENALNPEIYNRGIVRICSTGNPGLGTDSSAGINGSRWVQVGVCGEGTNLGCWLDTQSVDKVIEFENLEEESLNETADNYLNILLNEGDYIDNKEYLSSIEQANLLNGSDKIEFVSSILERVFYNNQKGYLLFLRGGAYADIARDLYEKIKVENEAVEDIVEDVEVAVEGIEEEILSNTDSEKVVENLRIKLDVKSPLKLEYQDGTFRKNVCYAFFDEGWHWTYDCTPEGTIDSTTPRDNSIGSSREHVTIWNSVSDLSNFDLGWLILGRNTEEESKFISSLEDKNFDQGLALLLGRALRKGDELLTPYSEFNDKRIFVLSYENVGEVYFKFENDKWYWNQNSASPESVDWIVAGDFFTSVPVPGEAVVDIWYEDLTYALAGKDYSDGSKLIFLAIGDEFESSGSFVDVSGESCPVAQELDEVKSISSSLQKVIKATEILDAQPVPEGLDVDLSGGDTSCYDAAAYVYAVAGVDLPSAETCFYSDAIGKEYSLSRGKVVETGGSTSSIYQVNPSKCKFNSYKEETKKLNLLADGFLISYAFYAPDESSKYPDGAGHNAIFVGWEDEKERIAKLFDWNGGSGRTYRYFTEDLSDDIHPVYIFWAPSK